MLDKDKDEKKLAICVETSAGFSSIQDLIQLAAGCVVQLKMIEAIEYLKVCGRLVQVLEKKIKKVMDEL